MDQPNLSKKEKIALKRQMKEEAKMKAQKQKSAKKWGIAAVVVVILVLGFYWLNNSSTPPAGLDGESTKVLDTDWVTGAEAGAATLIEYGDFQCPACGSYFPLVKEMEKTFPDSLTVVFRHFPLTQIHKNAFAASLAAEAAGRQGKFWEMHDMLFQTQAQWQNVGNADEVFRSFAESLELDMERYDSDIAGSQLEGKIESDRLSGISLGVQGTPTFILNGKKLQNPGSLEEFQALIQAEIDNAPMEQGEPLAVHEHADFAVYVNGEELDFSDEKYQSHEDNELDEDMHLHSENGTILHKHKKGALLGEFFSSLGMELTSECLTLDTKEQYCNSDDANLKMYVNGEENTEFESYEFQDLDRIVISYGDENSTERNSLDTAVTDEACIYSETCPERGTPPDEECVGGLGTNCE